MLPSPLRPSLRVRGIRLRPALHPVRLWPSPLPPSPKGDGGCSLALGPTPSIVHFLPDSPQLINGTAGTPPPASAPQQGAGAGARSQGSPSSSGLLGQRHGNGGQLGIEPPDDLLGDVEVRLGVDGRPLVED